MIRKDIPLTGRVGRRNQFRSWHAFIAPEIETKFFHDEKVDMFSLGAIIYTLLCGIAPVKGAPLFEVIQPSNDAQHLVRQLLQEDPNRRMDIDDVLRHPWMHERDEVLAQHDLFLTKEIFGDYLNSGR
jgi:serine/threonine protein kinase